ncbi:hypothetical protein [Geminocystis herdmanii]|uniref:hypothetical protein n=1 Tax=Geminocystis herdmanii TaxID=669359 RepID=UPI00034D8B1A|nr:hypothetical protein [Geminocystis herdmanii]
MSIEPVKIPEKLPFLQAICWQQKNVYDFNLEEMLSRYERGWHYRSLFNNLQGEELDFLIYIAQKYHSWLLTEL